MQSRAGPEHYADPTVVPGVHDVVGLLGDPDHSVVHGLPRNAVPHHDGLPVRRDADASDLRVVGPGGVEGTGYGATERPPQRHRVELRPAGMRVRPRHGLAAFADDEVRELDGDGAQAARPRVDGEQQWRAHAGVPAEATAAPAPKDDDRGPSGSGIARWSSQVR